MQVRVEVQVGASRQATASKAGASTSTTRARRRVPLFGTGGAGDEPCPPSPCSYTALPDALACRTPGLQLHDLGIPRLGLLPGSCLPCSPLVDLSGARRAPRASDVIIELGGWVRGGGRGGALTARRVRTSMCTSALGDFGGLSPSARQPVAPPRPTPRAAASLPRLQRLCMMQHPYILPTATSPPPRTPQQHLTFQSVM